MNVDVLQRKKLTPFCLIAFVKKKKKKSDIRRHCQQTEKIKHPYMSRSMPVCL